MYNVYNTGMVHTCMCVYAYHYTGSSHCTNGMFTAMQLHRYLVTWAGHGDVLVCLLNCIVYKLCRLVVVCVKSLCSLLMQPDW